MTLKEEALLVTGMILIGLETNHVEEVADFGSFGQIPHVNVAIMSSRQHDTGVKWVSLHYKHLVIVTL